jgi:DNA-binding NtrC family response regulator
MGKAIRARKARASLMLLTRVNCGDVAGEALKNGFDEYIREPFTGDELLAAVGRCWARWSARLDNGPAEDELREGRRLIGDSPQARELRTQIGQVAHSDANVLITGETGTGKELAAELIHVNSARGVQPVTLRELRGAAGEPAGKRAVRI